MMKQLIALLLVFVILLAGCPSPTGNVPAIDSIKDDLTSQIANLPLMELSSVENFERYKSVADNLNDLIEILNQNNELFNIPAFEATMEGWNKASRLITEYGPLIDNYNEVVSAAKIYESNKNEESSKKFYIAAGKFGFEASLIVFTVFYSAAFQSVGIVYRAVGLNRLALKCGSCVSVILRHAHWFVRTTLVEGASQLAQQVIEWIPDKNPEE